MATKVFQKDLWVARNDDESIWSFLAEPIKDEKEGAYFYKDFDTFLKLKKEDNIPLIGCLYNKDLTNIQKELNLTNIKEPYKIKVTVVFEDLPDVDKAGLPCRPEMLQKAANVVREYTDCLLITKYELSELKARIRNLEQIKEAYFSLKEELKLALKDIEI